MVAAWTVFRTTEAYTIRIYRKERYDYLHGTLRHIALLEMTVYNLVEVLNSRRFCRSICLYLFQAILKLKNFGALISGS